MHLGATQQLDVHLLATMHIVRFTFRPRYPRSWQDAQEARQSLEGGMVPLEKRLLIAGIRSANTRTPRATRQFA